MLTKLFTTALLKVLDDKKVDEFAEKVADKVAMKVINAVLTDLKNHLGK